MNLESLRRKRVKRMGIKSRSQAGQRRIFFLLDRATKKFHGDIGLWMQYISFARKQKSNKKLSKILTSALRLHPTKSELWVYAAKYAQEEQDDILEARSYMQRGLRFCKYSKVLWTEYLKLEMIYIAKVVARGRILGLTKGHSKIDSVSSTEEELNGDIVSIPKDATLDLGLDPQMADFIGQETLQELRDMPLLTGAIPIAIFDMAMKQFAGDQSLCSSFFDVIVEFQDVPCTASILQHIIDYLLLTAPLSPTTLFCFIRQPTIGIEPLSPEFPRVLAVALDRLDSTLQNKIPSQGPKMVQNSRCLLMQKLIKWILPLIVKDLDPDIRKVLVITLRRLWAKYNLELHDNTELDGGSCASLLVDIQRRGLQEVVESSMPLALDDQDIKSV